MTDRLFVDTSFWIALLRTADQNHKLAAAAAGRTTDAPLTTSSAILAETWTMLRHRVGHHQAWSWLDRVRGDTHCRIERVTPELEEESWAWLRVHDERPYSFVDATSFALMRRLRISEALAFDGDFAAAGFVELRS